MRKQSWEQGQIDYMGRDSFENIWKKISETLNVPQLKRQPSPPKVRNSIDLVTKNIIYYFIISNNYYEILLAN